MEHCDNMRNSFNANHRPGIYIHTYIEHMRFVLYYELILNSIHSKAPAPFAVYVVTVMKMLYSFGLICVYCEMCEEITSGFEEVADAIYQLDWYTYPLDIQRMLPLVLNYAQQPVQTIAFGNIPCTRETFKKVNHMDTYQIQTIHLKNIFNFCSGHK